MSRAVPLLAAAAILLIVGGVTTVVVLDMGARDEPPPVAPRKPVKKERTRQPKKTLVSDDPKPRPKQPVATGTRPPPVVPTHEPAPENTPEGWPLEVKGQVVSDETGEAVPGATIGYTVERPGAAPAAMEAKSDGSGAYRVRIPVKEDLGGAVVELRVRATGFEDQSVIPGTTETDVRLRPRTASLRLGRVVGVARRGADGFTGRIMVEGRDAFGRYEAQWAVAGEDGSFVLEGVRPGTWRFQIHGSTDVATVTIGDAGEASIELKLENGEKAAGIVPVSAKTRELVVTGLPDGGGHDVVVRAFMRDEHFWRAASDGTQATFPKMPIGQWTVVVEADGRELVRRAVDVAEVEGGEPLVLTLDRTE